MGKDPCDRWLCSELRGCVGDEGDREVDSRADGGSADVDVERSGDDDVPFEFNERDDATGEMLSGLGSAPSTAPLLALRVLIRGLAAADGFRLVARLCA